VSGADERRLMEAIHERSQQQERLFRTIASLGNCLDRDVVIETIRHILGVDPVENDDGVLFDDITVSFDSDGRVKGLYRVIDGSDTPARRAIKSGGA
jgi:hypothetical protein